MPARAPAAALPLRTRLAARAGAAGAWLTATSARRSALWAGTGALVLVVATASVGYALADVAPSGGTRMLLDGLAVLAVALGYGLAVHARAGGGAARVDPLRALWVPLVGAGLVLAGEAAVGALVGGRLRGSLPDLSVALAGVGVGLAEAILAVGIVVALRPLVLYRRRRWTLAWWRAMLAAALVAALAVAGRPVDLPAQGAAVALEAGVVLVGAGLALRQRWTAALSLRQRLAAAPLALGLAAVLVVLLLVRTDGPGGVAVADAAGAVTRVPYGQVLSRSAGGLATLAMGFGALYGLTAGLVLVFGLPALGAARPASRPAFAPLAGPLLDRAALAESLAAAPVEAGLADTAWLALADLRRGSLALHTAAAAGPGAAAGAAAADADALARAAREAGGLLALGRAEADHRVRLGAGVGSLAVLALADADGAPRGALFAARRTPDALEADDLAALRALAAQAALALDHADLLADALDRERLARELALAREVQLRLFPRTLPDVPGLGLAAAERPAREVGGDYYDALALGDDCVGVVVADVSGKGTAAAFHMAEMKGLFQIGARLTRSPGEWLARAQEALAPSLGRGTFVSAVYAVVDARAGTLALARAGHGPAVLARDPARADGGTWLLRGRGVAIGLGSADLFRRTLSETALRLAPGDAVVLSTDGLAEARSPAGEPWGYDRLADTVARHRVADPEALRDALLEAHRAWTTPADGPTPEPTDDLALVVLCWTGPDAADGTAPADGRPPISERPAFDAGLTFDV